MAFPIFPDPPHDPSGQPSDLYQFRLNLNPRQAITTATVTVVDDSDTPVVSPDLTVLDIGWGVISGTVWGVTFRVQNGSPQIYKLRLRYTTDRGVPPAGSDITMRLRCAQT